MYTIIDYYLAATKLYRFVFEAHNPLFSLTSTTICRGGIAYRQSNTPIAAPNCAIQYGTVYRCHSCRLARFKPLCSIQKVANIEDDTSSDACEVFQIATVAGGMRYVKIDRGRRLVQLAINAEAPRLLHYATQLGWRPNFAGFVLEDGYVSGPGMAGTVLPPPWADDFAEAHEKKGAGSLKSWQTFVARPAAKSLCGPAAVPHPNTTVSGGQRLLVLGSAALTPSL